jgi:phage-related protein
MGNVTIRKQKVTDSYNKTQLDALIPQIYSWNETLHVSYSSSVHHQEFFTVHTAIGICHTCLLTACERDPDPRFQEL